MTVTFGGAKVSSLSWTGIPRRHEKIVTAWPWAVKPLARSRRWELTPPSQYGGEKGGKKKDPHLSTLSRPLFGPAGVVSRPPEPAEPNEAARSRKAPLSFRRTCKLQRSRKSKRVIAPCPKIP